MNGYRVVSYMKCIPPGNKKAQKPLIIRNFIEGVNRHGKQFGDQGVILNSWTVVDADVSVIQGFTHENSQRHRHLMLRKAVYEGQQRRDKRCMIVDSSLFLYADITQSRNYLRYGYDGIFPNTAEYCWDNPDPQRWEKIKKDLNIELKPWRLGGGQYILICCQRDGGWSMQGMRVINWLAHTIRSIRTVTNRPIRVRFHPGDKGVQRHQQTIMNWIHTGDWHYKNVEISGAKDIRDEFAHAHAVVGHNSSPTVASVIEGIPTLVTDPDRAQSKDVALQSWQDLEKLQPFDREKWIQKIAQVHWTLDEVKDGLAWQHLRNFVK